MLKIAIPVFLTAVVLSTPSFAIAQGPGAKKQPPAESKASDAYPRDKPLDEVHVWIRNQPEGRASFLREDLSDLARRCRDDLRTGTPAQKTAAIWIAFDLEKIGRPPRGTAFEIPADLDDACVALLMDKDLAVRQAAAGLASNIAPLIPSIRAKAVPPLLEMLKETDNKLRRAAALSLRNLAGPEEPLAPGFGNEGEAVVTALIPYLDDTDQTLRSSIFMTIGSCGEAARPAVPRLIEFAEAKKPELKAGQRAAILTLGRLKPFAAQTVPTFRGLLRSSDESVSRGAIVALRTFGPAARDAVPDLIELLDAPDQNIRQLVASALGAVGPDASIAVPKLQRMLRDGPSDDDRQSAATSLGKVGPAAVVAINDLIAALDSPDKSLRWCAARALGDIGPASSPALERISRQIREDPDVLNGEGPRIIAKILGKDR